MTRLSIADAGRDLAHRVERVRSEGISVELERENQVIARLTPAEPTEPLTVEKLNAFMQSLPPLEDDADEFLRDLRAIRNELPIEAHCGHFSNQVG